MSRNIMVMCAMLGSLSMGSAALAENLTAAWSDLLNPNGNWSVQDSDGAITVHQDNWAPHASEWSGQDAWARAATGRGHVVAWMRSDRTLQGLANGYDLLNGDVLVQTWDSGSGALDRTNLSRVVWTAPAPGTYTIAGSTWLAVNAGPSASVSAYANGIPIGAVSLSDSDAYSRNNPFTFGASDVALNAGDTVEVRFVTTSQNSALVGVDLSVVPEPSSVFLAIAASCAFVGFACYRRRTNRILD